MPGQAVDLGGPAAGLPGVLGLLATTAISMPCTRHMFFAAGKLASMRNTVCRLERQRSRSNSINPPFNHV